MMRIEWRVGAICEERGIDAGELARRCGFSESTARRLMAGDRRRRVGYKIMAGLCRGLDVQPGELFQIVPDELAPAGEGV